MLIYKIEDKPFIEIKIFKLFIFIKTINKLLLYIDIDLFHHEFSKLVYKIVTYLYVLFFLIVVQFSIMLI